MVGWETLVTVIVKGPGCLLTVEDLKVTVPPEPVTPESVPLTTPLQATSTVALETRFPRVSLMVMTASGNYLLPSYY